MRRSWVRHTKRLREMLRSVNRLEVALAIALLFGQGVASCVCAPGADSHEHLRIHGAAPAVVATLGAVASGPAVAGADSDHDRADGDSCCCIGPSDNAVPPDVATPAMRVLPDLFVAALGSPPEVVLPPAASLPGIFSQDSGPPGQSPPSNCFGRAPPVA